jgi:hypothetical protein
MCCRLVICSKATFPDKFAGSLFKQHSYQKELFSSIDNIKAQVSRVKEESEHCMQRRVADMQKSIVNTDQNATKSLQLLQALYNQLILQEPRSSFDQGEYERKNHSTDRY